MQTYQYDRGFQAVILATMIRDAVCTPSYRDVLNAQYFEDPDHQAIAAEILEFYDRYHAVPTWSALRALINDRCARLKLDDKRTEGLMGVITAVESAECVTADFVFSRIVEFGKRQSLFIATNKIIDILKKGDGYDEARKIVEDALSVGAARSQPLELFSAANNLSTLLSESAYSGTRIPTGIPSLDTALKGGVAGPQLGIFQAPPKTGKSVTLANVGLNAAAFIRNMQAGKPITRGVLHISYELYREDILVMYLARMTGMTRDELAMNSALFYSLWPQASGLLAPDVMKIEYFKPWSMTHAGS